MFACGNLTAWAPPLGPEDTVSPMITTPTRVGLAMIVNTMTPYRVHLLSRLAAELPNIELHTLSTHGNDDFAWTLELASEIGYSSIAEPGEASNDAWWHRPLVDLGKAHRIIDYLRSHDIRAVVLHGYNRPSRAIVTEWCTRSRIPVFLRADSNIIGELDRGPMVTWAKRRVVRWFIERSAAVMPFGELGERFFLKYGADSKRCFWVPCEPDYASYTAVRPGAVDDFRLRYGLDSDRRRLLFCGRLVPVKGVDLLVDAFTRIAEVRPNWDVLIAGDGPLRRELQARSSPEMAKRISFLGFLQGAELTTAYHACDVLVLPSRYEPWGLVVNEALASGLAIVASDVTGAAHELVKDRRSGRIFESGNVSSLATALLDATESARNADYRAAAPSVLAEWRDASDPVDGMRRALQSVGLLGQSNLSAVRIDAHG